MTPSPAPSSSHGSGDARPPGQAHAFLSPSEAAGRLGVSIKALRLYEAHGLLAPVRSSTGWRTYGPAQMAAAAAVVALRRLGFSLAQIGRTLAGDPAGLDAALAAHEAALQARASEITEGLGRMRALRRLISSGKAPSAATLAEALSATPAGAEWRPTLSFDLPWPWGGERFDLPELGALTYIVGPLGSGKTRLAMRLADLLPGATFLRLERSADIEAVRSRVLAETGWRTRVDAAIAWMQEDGATPSDALYVLTAALEADGDGPLVIDMVEQGLDEATQGALAAWLRRRAAQATARPLVMLTRSTAILDMSDMQPDEAVIFCPANHSTPLIVGSWPGAPGREAAASCLAAPDVRARTQGMMAMMPDAGA